MIHTMARRIKPPRPPQEIPRYLDKRMGNRVRAIAPSTAWIDYLAAWLYYEIVAWRITLPQKESHRNPFKVEKILADRGIFPPPAPATPMAHAAAQGCNKNEAGMFWPAYYLQDGETYEKRLERLEIGKREKLERHWRDWQKQNRRRGRPKETTAYFTTDSESAMAIQRVELYAHTGEGVRVEQRQLRSESTSALRKEIRQYERTGRFPGESVRWG